VPGSDAAPVMLLIDMAREGGGTTWAPRSLVDRDLATGRLLRAGPETWDNESRRWTVRRHRNELRPRVAKLPQRGRFRIETLILS